MGGCGGILLLCTLPRTSTSTRESRGLPSGGGGLGDVPPSPKSSQGGWEGKITWGRGLPGRKGARGDGRKRFSTPRYVPLSMTPLVLGTCPEILASTWVAVSRARARALNSASILW